MIDQIAAWAGEQAKGQIFGGIAAASVVGYLGFQARNLPGRLVGWFDSLFTVEMSVRSDDSMYAYIAQWLSEQKFMAKSRRLKLISATVSKYAADDSDNAPTVRPGSAYAIEASNTPQWVLVPATGFHWMFYRGSLLLIHVDDGSSAPPAGGGGPRFTPLETMNFRSFGRSPAVMRRMITEATTLIKAEYRVRVYSSEGAYWSKSTKKIPRPLRSVITAGGLGERMLEDMRKFLVSREWYTSRGIPWRRGYLFNGPPGTGKSSLVMALASELRCPIYTISLGTAITDGDVANLLISVPERAIVLIEDIDTFQVAQDRTSATKDGESKGLLTLSGLLNGLDGVAASEGRIAIMTTNHPERLDAALTRPGRVDVSVRLDNFGADESARMWRLFFGDVHPLELAFMKRVPPNIQPAALQELMMRHANDPARLIEETRQREAA